MVRYGFGPDEAAMVERALGRAAQHRRRGQPAGRRPALGIRNPATGATIKIAASKAVRFRVSKPLKDAVNK